MEYNRATNACQSKIPQHSTLLRSRNLHCNDGCGFASQEDCAPECHASCEVRRYQK
jgi:hypothetical protein